MKIPEQMSLIELLGEKVMLFTCETVALSMKVSTINLDSDNVSQESSGSTEYSPPDKSAILVREHYFFSGSSNVLAPMRCG